MQRQTTATVHTWGNICGANGAPTELWACVAGHSSGKRANLKQDNPGSGQDSDSVTPPKFQQPLGRTHRYPSLRNPWGQ